MSKLFDLLGLGTGRKFYMRDYRNAYKFRPDVNPVRQKFQGYVNFVFNRDLYAALYNESGDSSNEFRTTISSLIRTAELPGVEFKTETLNRYNSKKIVNTGVQYTPVNFTVYDTVGNEWLTVLMKYFAYYYMNPRNGSSAGDRDIEGSTSRTGGADVVGSSFGPGGAGNNFNSNKSGYNPQLTSNLLERIDYVLYHGGRAVQYSIINPYITAFRAGDLDYSDSNHREFQFTVEYEKFTVHNVTNFGLSEEDLDRFENASNLTGPAFAPDELSPALDQTDLAILGSKDAPRFRTAQPELDRLANQDLVRPDNVPPVYGEPLDLRSTAEQDQGGFFSDLLGNVADSVLTAAIHGGDIRDAAFGAAVGSTVAAVGEVVEQQTQQTPRNSISPSSRNQSTDAVPPPRAS